jgi:hypothetical protein
MSRDTRREENQKLFRKGNELLRNAVAGDVSEGKPVPFLCECAEDCRGRVEITLSQWESVASQPNHFLIETGHLRGAGERFVGSLGDYEVVRKPASR